MVKHTHVVDPKRLTHIHSHRDLNSLSLSTESTYLASSCSGITSLRSKPAARSSDELTIIATGATILLRSLPSFQAQTIANWFYPSILVALCLSGRHYTGQCNVKLHPLLLSSANLDLVKGVFEKIKATSISTARAGSPELQY